jgi:hypothetical protein
VTASNNAIYAVLTGDLVGSVGMRAGGGPTVGELLRGASEGARTAFPQAGISAVDVFRGDSWQLYLEEAQWAGRVALFLRAWVRASGPSRVPYADTRVAIGLGAAGRLVPDRVSESEGQAFVASGSVLDSMIAGKPRRHARLGMAGLAAPEGPAADAALSLIDFVGGGWTPKQAWALCGLWRGLTQTEIGATFGERFGETISQHTVVGHLQSAGSEPLEIALDWLSHAIAQGSREEG